MKRMAIQIPILDFHDSHNDNRNQCSLPLGESIF